MRISDWSSDVCSSDLSGGGVRVTWSDAGDLGMRPLHRWFGLFFDRMIGGDFEKGLAKLKKLSETPDGVSEQLGRASCRERVCPYVYISVLAVYLKKKHKQISYQLRR